MFIMTGLIPYDFFGDRWLQSGNAGKDIFKIDVRDDDRSYLVEAELPGVSKNEVNLSVDDKTLSISISREESKNEGKGNYIHRERRESSMSRSIRLADANLNDIQAKLENGVLSVVVPKRDKPDGARRIEIA